MCRYCRSGKRSCPVSGTDLKFTKSGKVTFTIDYALRKFITTHAGIANVSYLCLLLCLILIVLLVNIVRQAGVPHCRSDLCSFSPITAQRAYFIYSFRLFSINR